MFVATPGFQFRIPIVVYICLYFAANANELLFFRIMASEPFLFMHFRKALVLFLNHIADCFFLFDLCSVHYSVGEITWS